MEGRMLSLFYRLWFQVCKAQVQELIGVPLKYYLLHNNFGTANLILIFTFFLEYLENKVLYDFKCSPMEYLAIFECTASCKWDLEIHSKNGKHKLVMANAKLRCWRLPVCVLKFPGRKWLMCSAERSPSLLPWFPDSLACLFQLF